MARQFPIGGNACQWSRKSPQACFCGKQIRCKAGADGIVRMGEGIDAVRISDRRRCIGRLIIAPKT